MSYTKTNWKTGDTISAEKLNKMEDGIAESGGEVLVVNGTEGENGGNVLDKTWQEIYDAMVGNKLIFVKNVSTDETEGWYSCVLHPVEIAGYNPGDDIPYTIGVGYDRMAIIYGASTANDYPSTSTGGSDDVN